MHVIRYQYGKKKKRNVLPVFLLLGISSVLFLFEGNTEIFGKLRRELRTVCYEETVKWYLPGMVYRGSEEMGGSLAEMVMAHFFPLGEADLSVGIYPTQVESELSYEVILAREAADENYVDANTGEVVMAANTQDTAGMPDQGTAAEETGILTQDGINAAAMAAGTGSQKLVTYSREKLSDFDFLIQNFYQVDNTTTINGEQLNAQTLLGKDMRLTHDASTPQILIYHTHSQEGYADSIPGNAATSVVGVADYLTQLLTEQYGFNVIHHKGEYDVGDRDHAYSKAGPALEQILAENPSIEVVIDLHRDGVAENTRLVTDINGMQTAQIMFFNGLSRTTRMGDISYLYNPYIEDNLAMSLQMQLAAAEYYPGFTRRIYLKGYRYNMHYCPKTLLIEVGAQTNTVQEAMNAMVPLADILNKVLTE